MNDPVYSSRLPYWIQAICPRVFYITEKSWNYYPYTQTGGWAHDQISFKNQKNIWFIK